ncbi:MAG: 50S ribosomal protein L9 [Anaerolineae bacterium]|nr:50S ribosomal protein L9 [Anaerolineae bacterium]
MKVVLLQDVYKQGVAGELVEVAPGFARNYLIPRGMAVKATVGALRRFENLRAAADLRRAERNKEYNAVAERLQGVTLYFGVRAGDTGKLYGSVTPGEIADALKEEIGLEIDRRRIGDKALRELGLFHVPVRLDANIVPTVDVVVFREGEDPRPQAEEAAAAEAPAEEAVVAEVAESAE